MIAVIETIFGRNITIVYKSLDLQSVDRNKLREIVPGVTPTIMDMPEMLVAVFPPYPWLIQFSDRRLHVNLSVESNELGEFPLWEYAQRAHLTVSPDKAPLHAYGFNFDFGVRFDGITPQELLISKFVSNRRALEEEIQGTLVSYMPRVVFSSDTIQYDIIFEPIDENRMKIHGNAHIEYPGIELPSSEELKALYKIQFERLRNTISKLIRE
ncbi:MAG: hypothetical protein ANABAC_1276 [Anaerolineae bacterium]|nr:MAG: hypothetical protein ANABAC_1276 [Anaerolineae bacterium]